MNTLPAGPLSPPQLPALPEPLFSEDEERARQRKLEEELSAMARELKQRGMELHEQLVQDNAVR